MLLITGSTRFGMNKMKKQLIGTLLVLMFLAPQTGLVADDDNHKHKDKPPKPLKTKLFNSINVQFATKAELTTAVALVQADIDALVLQVGVTPDELAASLALLQKDIDANILDINMALEDITNMRLEDIAGIQGQIGIIQGQIDDINAFLKKLELPDLLVSDLVFSGNFFGGEEARFGIKFDWASFKSNAIGSFSSIKIRNSFDGGATIAGSVECADPAIATLIIKELNTHVPIPGPTLGSKGSFKSFTCVEPITSLPVNWNIGECDGEVELNADLIIEAVCGIGEGAVVRPLHPTKSWGGVGSDFGGSGGTSGAPSQTLEVILTR